MKTKKSAPRVVEDDLVDLGIVPEPKPAQGVEDDLPYEIRDHDGNIIAGAKLPRVEYKCWKCGILYTVRAAGYANMRCTKDGSLMEQRFPDRRYDGD